MNVAAFILIAAMLAAYVVLDGWDLGVGTIYLFLARTDRERAASLAAIAPFWNGNEVVLVAAAATLFALFPKVYAASFSGFYLPFIVVLWLLMARGMAMELRNHFPSDLWRQFWDAAFCLSSALLALLFGIALGNIVRGVPLDSGGYFNGTFGFLLNPYAFGVGVLAVAALSMHGSAYAVLRVDDPALGIRARKTSEMLWIAVIVLYAAVTIATLRFHAVSFGGLSAIAPVCGLLALFAARFTPSALGRFAASSVFLVAIVASAAETIFPFLLPNYPRGSGGLDIFSSAPGSASLVTGFAAALIGCALALIYGTLTAARILRAQRRAKFAPADEMGSGRPK